MLCHLQVGVNRFEEPKGDADRRSQAHYGLRGHSDAMGEMQRFGIELGKAAGSVKGILASVKGTLG